MIWFLPWAMHFMTYQLVSEQEENLRTDSFVYCRRGTGATPTSNGLVLGENFYLSAKNKNSFEKGICYFFHFSYKSTDSSLWLPINEKSALEYTITFSCSLRTRDGNEISWKSTK